tara:strand:+ start:30 stop:281 length:252 start_codon:yes stop_codon:yes gene_type:complete
LKEEVWLKFGKAKEAATFNSKTQQIRINLKYVESINHLYELIEHEGLHKAFDDLEIPIRKEHKLIDVILWASYMIPDDVQHKP